MTDREKLLTVEDVAQWLGVSPAWCRDHSSRKSPRLPVVRVGKLLRFRAADVEKWVEEQVEATRKAAA